MADSDLNEHIQQTTDGCCSADAVVHVHRHSTAARTSGAEGGEGGLLKGLESGAHHQ
jgi:hypothetical protein